MVFPKAEPLSRKQYLLRLHLQEAQDLINGIESLLDELHAEKNMKAFVEVEQTFNEILEQLEQQGISFND